MSDSSYHLADEVRQGSIGNAAAMHLEMIVQAVNQVAPAEHVDDDVDIRSLQEGSETMDNVIVLARQLHHRNLVSYFPWGVFAPSACVDLLQCEDLVW
eukprot:CAMPEP_0169197704 /NCGR_PEP_ID=MMETSP1016-20121227/8420_1 /TAXON_ID=342587 /ORGANISM="Karlodinium micrum, Strain CCMP2283" /LENGTH=97 /DNA_ID=CAMNT_0009274389 /DNA_START=103 /DNA_END=393 /DNA_ORIENTATION=-